MGNKVNLSGFSLIEVMVATVLMAFMSVLLMTSINTSIRAKDNVEHISNRFQEVRQAMSRMSREISMAYLSKNINHTEPSFATQFMGEKSQLFFSAFGNVVRQKDAKESDQQVLGFYLAKDKQGRQSLMRRHQANLNLDVKKEGRAQVLCANVSKLEFAYFDEKSDKWQESWSSDPAATVVYGQQGGRNSGAGAEKGDDQVVNPWMLPSLVRITMTLEMDEGNTMTFVSETEITVKEALDLS